ncbi:MAG: formate dehydrogenase subunit delta [Hyphomicrobium sp.]
MQPAEKLVMMANQIARNLAVQGEERAIALTAEHIRKFWDPRMRAKIVVHFEGGANGLNPIALRAIETIASVPAKA